MNAEVSNAATLIVGLLVLGMQVYRFLNGFQSKTAAEKIRADDDKDRRDRQESLDSRLGRIERTTTDTNEAVRKVNGTVAEIVRWRDEHVKVHIGLEAASATKKRSR